MKKEINFIDLFAGIGGFRIALEREGFKCNFSSEWNKECADTYEKNFGEIPLGDITKINEKDIPQHEIICGGFPCQAFSSAGLKKGFEDTRGTLFFEILRIAKEKKPQIVFLENVKNLKYHDKGNTLKLIIKSLEDLGYFVKWEILNAKDFGVPQNRERIIIIASKDRPFDFTKIKKIDGIPKIKDILEESKEHKYLDPSEYTLIDDKHITPQNYSGLIFVGYRNKPIRKEGVKPNTEHLSRVHKQCNRIYSSNGTHPTISSSELAGRYHIYHDGKVRKLTVNECYKLMGFPEDFKKVVSNGERYKQIGNSVAIPMIQGVAKQIKLQFFS
jgi:DNA (cytosine-5)-methyltransferase 1